MEVGKSFQGIMPQKKGFTMSDYKELTLVDGTKFIPKVWNFFFKPTADENFFVEPWDNRELADCAEFRFDQMTGLLTEIFFFVSDEELIHFLLCTRGQPLYLFGAYNQLCVCQMRSLGIVTNEDSHSETFAIKERLHAKILKRITVTVNKLDREEAQVRLALLENGRLFSFRPVNYAYAVYERG
jgi:hypothetical protein